MRTSGIGTPSLPFELLIDSPLQFEKNRALDHAMRSNGDPHQMKLVVTILAFALVMPATLSAEKKVQEMDPVVWGITSNNSGCVIFAEGHQTSGRFYGIAATTKTVGKLTLIESQNYTFDQKVIPETQENMDNLMRIAQNDHIKFVKIPEKYSPELLLRARTSCK